MNKNKDQVLKCEIVNDVLTISIGVSTLCFAVQNSDDWDGGEITNEAEFAKDILEELESESENGTTPVHSLLDTAANNAADSGSEWVKLEDEE